MPLLIEIISGEKNLNADLSGIFRAASNCLAAALKAEQAVSIFLESR